MNSLAKSFIASAFLATIALGPVAQAQDEKSRVVVKVNGHDITAAEIALAADDILPQLREVPKNLRYPFVVEYLVERHLLAQAAAKAGIQQNPEYELRRKFYEAKALRDAYFTTTLKPSITDKIVEDAYNAQVKNVKQVDRVRARHIVVSSEKEARDVIARLKAGEDFADLAKAVSKDGSKDFGGDLGYFTAAEMVPEFSKATFAMKTGEISEPVKTEFGWHVIKVEDRKKGGAQSFDDVKNAIKLVLLRKRVQDEIAKLRNDGVIEVLDPQLKKLQEQAQKQRDEQNKRREENEKSKPATSGKGDRAD